MCGGLQWKRAYVALRALGFPRAVSDGAQERALVSDATAHPKKCFLCIPNAYEKSNVDWPRLCCQLYKGKQWKPLWKAENSPVAFGCHRGVSYRETISQPPPTLLSLALWLLQRVPKNPTPLPVPTNSGEIKL